MTGRLPQVLRADAADNRGRVLASARALFTAAGLDAPVREVARRAGVAPATVYRRFPSKRTLVDEVYADEMLTCSRTIEEGLADPDPWRGFAAVVLSVAEANAHNRHFMDAFLATVCGATDADGHRDEALAALDTLVARAQRAGTLRADFVLQDLVLVVVGSRGLGDAPLEQRLTEARRSAALALEAFRARTDASPLPPAAPGTRRPPRRTTQPTGGAVRRRTAATTSRTTPAPSTPHAPRTTR